MNRRALLLILLAAGIAAGFAFVALRRAVILDGEPAPGAAPPEDDAAGTKPGADGLPPPAPAPAPSSYRPPARSPSIPGLEP